MQGCFYNPKHFTVQELVDTDTFTKFGDQALTFLDCRLLYTLDRIRERYNAPTFINTWSLPGSIEGLVLKTTLQFRGYRPVWYPLGAEHSQHRHGRASDVNVLHVDVETIRQDILANPQHEDFKFITCIGQSNTFLHLDVRNWNKATNGILLI